ncbi:exopolysaccharide biosynthesis polyprenyl glycosylphosphotransferase [Geminicoccaceae bacterium 1502E]|nr:exopolysaccharide biosynthesis polyprenyl glycosylphosphotransferase [Geminicoccaceae bacterium 1502E]
MSFGAGLLAPHLSRGSRLSISSIRLILVTAIRATDILVIATTGLLAAWFRFDRGQVPDVILVSLCIGALLAANILPLCRVYRLQNLVELRRQLPRLLLGWLVTLGAVVGTLYVGHSAHEASRLWVGYWLVAGAAGLVLCRLGLWVKLTRGSLNAIRYRLAVIGPSETVAQCIEGLLRQDPHAQVKMTLGLTEGAPAGSSALDTLERRLAAWEVDRVLLATERLAPELASVVERLSHFAVEVAWVPQLPANMPGAAKEQIFVPLLERPIDGWSYVAKTMLDRILAAAGLIVLSPVLLLIAALIKSTSRGPVFYRQKRAGFNHEIITIYKFRTMHAEHCDGPDAVQTRQVTRHDERITPLGRFLRHTSLDELPQLINVLVGEMSLVGPRPHALPHDELYNRIIKKYYIRCRVVPGITGWAQINGLRGETDTIDKMEKRIEHDIYYINHWSLIFDLQIILRTFVCGFMHPQAR